MTNRRLSAEELRHLSAERRELLDELGRLVEQYPDRIRVGVAVSLLVGVALEYAPDVEPDELEHAIWTALENNQV